MKVGSVIYGALSLALLAGCAGASAGPKGPYLQEVSPHSIVVCWETEAPAVGRVDYGPGARLAAHVSERTPTVHHVVRLSGLKPGHRYQYRITPSALETGGEFTTAPASSHADVTFEAYGDTRTHADIHAQIASAMAALRPAFVLQTGDLVADGRVADQWNDFFRSGAPLFAEAPLYPAPGNHEHESQLYYDFWTGGPNHPFYSFDYAGIHCISLDSNQPRISSPEQLDWLEQDLKAHQNARFILVYFHHTPYTCVDIPDRLRLSVILRAALEPLFLKYRVDLVVNGHDHTYQHHRAHGLDYIVTGGGGAPLYGVRPQPYTLKAASVHNWVRLDAHGDLLHVRAYQLDGSLLDDFTVHSRRALRLRPIQSARRPVGVAARG